MPWGADALFRKRSMLNFNFRAPVSVKTKGRVAYRLYQLPESRERYRKTLHGLLKEHWVEDKLLAECDRIEALIKPHLNREQYRFTQSLDGTRDFIEARRGDLMKETGDSMPAWRKEPKAPPVIAAIGKIKARFSATWMEDSPRERTNIGKVETQPDHGWQGGCAEGRRRACVVDRRLRPEQQAVGAHRCETGRQRQTGVARPLGMDENSFQVSATAFNPAVCSRKAAAFRLGRWACSSSAAKPSSPQRE